MPILADTHRYPLILAGISRFLQIPANTCQYQPIPACTNQYPPIHADTCWYQHRFQNWYTSTNRLSAVSTYKVDISQSFHVWMYARTHEYDLSYHPKAMYIHKIYCSNLKSELFAIHRLVWWLFQHFLLTRCPVEIHLPKMVIYDGVIVCLPVINSHIL